eukprot:TRINITY_DN14773_c0_g1_i1.p1 TRINITY_DN14773_c0_g1~~TRINITY_DN14773_c0_g1_i1.p1  ORF type:complete len:184 (+),score=80.52 TRINITY_DN14773_c0_g1_i1:55-606(+)
MIHRFAVVLVVLAAAMAVATATAADSDAAVAAAPPTIGGKWWYRSWFNLPTGNHTADELIFARGEFTFDLVSQQKDGVNKYQGTLVGKDRNSPGKFWRLNVAATETPNTWNGAATNQVQILATGIDGTISAGWEYAYIGIVVPAWPGGYQQNDTFVGSVKRVHGHHPLGLVASFACTRALEQQ